MRATLIRSSLVGLAFVGAMALGTFAIAETVVMKAELKGSNGVKGAGNAAVTYDTATKKLSWKLSYSGLTGP